MTSNEKAAVLFAQLKIQSNNFNPLSAFASEAYDRKTLRVGIRSGRQYRLLRRPDTGAAPISYPCPTRSAIIGMLECVAFSKDAYYWPERVEICKPVVYHKYDQNYNGPLRKAQGPFQLMQTVLENVNYKIYGIVKGCAPPSAANNPMHQLQEVFLRRLEQGIVFRTPCLGLKEFVPMYFGPLRADTVPDKSVNLLIPSMLDTMYDRQIEGRLCPRFVQNVRIEQGVVRFAE